MGKVFECQDMITGEKFEHTVSEEAWDCYSVEELEVIISRLTGRKIEII